MDCAETFQYSEYFVQSFFLSYWFMHVHVLMYFHTVNSIYKQLCMHSTEYTEHSTQYSTHIYQYLHTYIYIYIYCIYIYTFISTYTYNMIPHTHNMVSLSRNVCNLGPRPSESSQFSRRECHRNFRSVAALPMRKKEEQRILSPWRCGMG